MELEELWQNNVTSDPLLNTLLSKGNFDSLHSRLPLNTLRQKLLTGIILAVLITLVYLVLFFYLHFWQAYITLTVLILFNIFVTTDTWRLYRQTPSHITPSNSLKEELTLHYNRFEQWKSLQQKISLFVYPVALIGGFVTGGMVGSGKPAEAFLLNPKILGLLGITLIIMIPLCYYGAQLMFSLAYGKHLKRLKAIIDELG